MSWIINPMREGNPRDEKAFGNQEKATGNRPPLQRPAKFVVRRREEAIARAETVGGRARMNKRRMKRRHALAVDLAVP